MPTSQHIALRPLIRYLGLLIPLLIGVPYAIGTLYFVLNPDVAVKEWPGVLMSVFFATLGLVSGWRWWRIGAEIGQDEIAMRGLLFSVYVPIDGFDRVNKVWIETNHHEQGKGKTYQYRFVDANESVVGKIPASVEMCVDFQSFLSKLEQIAAGNRKTSAGSSSRQLSSKPVDEWTIQDIERYEQEN
ncbi:hypothetical protein [Stieleria varia]|uniref:Uncharacterized protein n=1 Tax=Stieleria varia TaxID=2528005 RepID=A0A5C6ATC8_9BACT|nr:hypothetical protein [Stieleria varia]TWU02529.1 hypothetical protein Pla52n_35790 [Stieleria varia]